MFTLFHMELRRAFFRWQTLFACILMIASFMWSYYQYHLSPEMLVHINTKEHNAFIAFLYGLAAGPDTFLCLIIPLIMVLFGGDSFAWDRRSGIFAPILMRVNYRRYIVSKITSVSLISFAIIFALQWVAYILALMQFPATTLTELGSLPLYGQSIASSHPMLYLLLLTFNTSMMGAAYALLSLLLSLKLRNLLAILALPWLSYMGLTIFLETIGLKPLGPAYLGAVYLTNEVSYSTWQIPAFWIGIWILIAFSIYNLFCWGYRKGAYSG